MSRKDSLFLLFLFFSFIIPALADESQFPPNLNFKISFLEFKEMPTQDVIDAICKQANVSVFFDAPIKGQTNVSFKEILAKDALESVFKSNNLSFKFENEIFHVFKAPKLNWPDNKSSIVPLVSLPEENNVLIRSLEFRDCDIKDVLYGLCGLVKISLLIDPVVNGIVSFNLYDSKLQDVFNAILKNQGLNHEWLGNVLLILPAKIGPMVEEEIFLRNRKVDDLFDVMYEMVCPLGTFSTNVASNSISFVAPKEVARATRSLLKVLDSVDASLGEKPLGRTKFLNWSDQKVVFGANTFSIELNSSPASQSTSLKFYLGWIKPERVRKIGELSYDSLEIGSGTCHPVEIRCTIGISVIDKKTGNEVDRY